MLNRDTFNPNHRLFFLFLPSSFGSQYPFSLSMNISLMLNGNAAEMAEDVLHSSIGMAAGGTAEVINPGHADQEIVDDSYNDNNADGVTPDDNHGDNGSI